MKVTTLIDIAAMQNPVIEVVLRSNARLASIRVDGMDQDKGILHADVWAPSLGYGWITINDQTDRSI